MREQIRLWFYSQLFMSVVLTGRAPFRQVLGYEKMLDESGQRDARLAGQHDRGDGRVRAHGRGRDALAVLRAAAEPEPALRLRPGRADQARAADALELGRRSSSRTRTSTGFRPSWPAARSRRATSRRSTAGSSSARTRSCATAEAGYEAFMTVDVMRAYEDVRRRSLELVHPPFAPPLLERRARRARDALVRARPDAARAVTGDAVPHRASVAQSRARRAGVGASRGVAGRRRARRGAARRRSPTCAASSRSRTRRARPRG